MHRWLRLHAMKNLKCVAVASGIALGIFYLFYGCIEAAATLFGDSAGWAGLPVAILALISMGSAVMYWDIVRSEKRRLQREIKSRMTIYYSRGDRFLQIQ